MFRMKNKTLDGSGKISKNTGTYLVLLLALGAMTFFGVCDPSSRFRGPQGSAAVVGDEVISRADFNRSYRLAHERYQRQYGDQFDAVSMRLAYNVMAELVGERIMYTDATKLGMEASDEEVMKILAEAEVFKDDKGAFSTEAFENYLRGNGYTEAQFMEEIRRNITVQKMRRFVTDTSYVSSKAAELDYKLGETKLDLEYLKFDPQTVKVSVSPAEIDTLLSDEVGKTKVKDYFETNKKEFNQEERVKARHILVSYKGARNATLEAQARNKDEAKKRAEDIIILVKAPGADFAEIAKKSTDEAAGKASGGDLGSFTKGDMVKEFSDAAFALEPGQVSGVVESPFGFHVIRVEEKTLAKSTSLDEAQRKIAETILMKDKKPALAKEEAEKVLAALEEGGNAQDLLAKYNVSWQETGEVAANARYFPGIGSDKEVSAALASLSKPGQLYKTPVDVRGNLFLLKLKTRKEPNMAQFNAEKEREIATSAAYSEGFAFFSAYEKHIKDTMQKQDKIWMNPEFLALDQRQTEGSGS